MHFLTACFCILLISIHGNTDFESASLSAHIPPPHLPTNQTWIYNTHASSSSSLSSSSSSSFRNNNMHSPARNLLSYDLNTPISQLSTTKDLNMIALPENGFFSPTALAVFLRCTSPTAVVYWTTNNLPPTFASSSLTYDTPYLNLAQPYGCGRHLRVRAIATETTVDSVLHISEEIDRTYLVESAARPLSKMYFIPGIDTDSYFVRVNIETAAAERAQASSGQEFADFNTSLGVGTYYNQVIGLHLKSVCNDDALTGFEGGFSGQ